MPFMRSDTAFFHQEDAHRIIEKVAEQDSLVVYAGAGVSIDRTGLSWPSLVEQMMKDHIPEADVRQVIMSSNSSLQAATIVSQMYRSRSGEKDATHVIVNKLRTLLYAGRAWQRGELAMSIVQLIAELSNKDKPFRVVTTNYDAFIEDEIRVLNARRRKLGMQGIKLTRSVVNPAHFPDKFDIDEYTTPGRLVYLHGHVSRSVEDDEKVDGRGLHRKADGADKGVTLSEVDYRMSHAPSSAILEDLFEKSSVLIVGSSLTDPPLLNALAKVTNGREVESRNKYLRVAIMPLQGLGIHKQDSRLINTMKKNVTLRMEQFGVKVLFPDFYSQVPQFLNEVRICSEQCSSTRPYAGPWSPIRYESRLTSWWKEWWDSRCQKLVESQKMDHDTLRDELSEIEHQLGGEGEVIKLEIWLRWEPSGSKRQLKLWASSIGTWPHLQSMRLADIEAESNIFSVRSFCLGRPEIYATNNESDRWLTYLCVPIRIGSYENDLPVGVISLASMTKMEDSRVNASYGDQIVNITNAIRKIGCKIATPRSDGNETV